MKASMSSSDIANLMHQTQGNYRFSKMQKLFDCSYLPGICNAKLMSRTVSSAISNFQGIHSHVITKFENFQDILDA